MSTGGYQLTVNSDGSSAAPTAYYSSNGPSLPHLVAFTLATIGVAFTLGCVRMLLLYCRSRRADRRRSEGPLRNDTEALHTLWQRHLHRQRVMQQQQQSSAGASGKQQVVQVMVVQPGDELAIGTQLPCPRELAVGLQRGSDREVAAKVVDEASSRDAAGQPSSS